MEFCDRLIHDSLDVSKNYEKMSEIKDSPSKIAKLIKAQRICNDHCQRSKSQIAFKRIDDCLKVIAAVLVISTAYHQVHGVMYPDSLANSTTCEEFSQFARFNPYSVLDEHWFVFYYWGPEMPVTEYVFEYPSPKKKSFIHYILDEHVSVPINWTARFVVMTNVVNNFSSLLVEVGDRGQFLKYPFVKVVKKGDRIVPLDVRFKQTGDKKYIGYMMCKEDKVLVMAKKSHIPRKKYIQEEASRIGYRGRDPKSYLYQGHSWMPIPEDDEETYWMNSEAQQRERDALDKMLEEEKATQSDDLRVD